MRVLITGASDGIGGAAAVKIAEEARKSGKEARLVLSTSGRKPAPQTVLDQLAALNAEVHFLTADLTEVAECRRLARTTLDILGGMDSFVSNAGGMAAAPLKDIDTEKWDFLFDLNVRPTLVIAQELHAALSKNGGSIVATSSMTGVLPMSGAGAYSASKVALSMLIRQMAQEWGPDGIRANAIAPGMIRTSLTEATYANEKVAAGRTALVPVRRIGRAEDMGSIIAFLAGPQSPYITGQVIVADGGVTDAMLGLIPSLPKK